MQPTSSCCYALPPPVAPPSLFSLPNNNNNNNKWDCPIFFFFYQLHRPHHRPRLRPIKLVKPHRLHYQSCSSNNLSALTFLHSTNNKYQEDNHDDEGYNNNNESCSHPYHKPSLFDEFSSSVELGISINEDPVGQNGREAETEGEKGEVVIQKRRGLFTNMWWVDVKAALGQRINVEGIVSSVSVFVKERHLALPHVSVPDIRYIDWVELQRRGFRGVVFDKDNTITVPYTLTLWGPLGSSMERCKSVFGNDIAVFSNSAGLAEYDHDGSKARALERAIGIKVLRHKVKKPAGTAEEIEKHFGCKSSQLIMVGDRPFTDVVYGNRNGFLTILTEPLSLTEEPFIVRQVRKLEMTLVNYWFRRGLKPTGHSLLPDALQCVKNPPPV